MDSDILVIGGGFAGFWASLAAKRIAGSNAGVTIVSPEPVLQMRPRLYEANPHLLGVDLQQPLSSADIDFIPDKAVGISCEDCTVELGSGKRIAFQRAVIATGSVMQRPFIPGAREAYSIDTQQDAINFDHKLQQISLSVEVPRFIIIGAGFSGIELALELRDRIGAHRDTEVADHAVITLLDRADVVGLELGGGPRAAIVDALNSASIDVVLNANATSMSAKQVTLANGTTLDADAVVLTTGLVAEPFVAHIPGEHDSLGRLFVNDDLSAIATRNIYVAGDNASADTGNQHRTLLSCQHALQTGRFAGENAARDLLGLATVPYRQEIYTTCLDLGRSGAVRTQGWERQVVEKGEGAKKRKRYINQSLIYPPLTENAETLLKCSSTNLAEQ